MDEVLLSEGHPQSPPHKPSGQIPLQSLTMEKIPDFQAYLGKEGLIDLHSLVGALQQHLLAAAPAVAHGRVGVGHAPEEHGLLIVKLLLGFPDALVDRDYGIIQIWQKTGTKNQD